MAAPLTRAQLLAALNKWFPNGGYEFVTAVGRPGTFAPIGFTVHHTGGPYTDSDSYLKFLFETGRPDEGIPAQLCHFAVGASGRLYIGDYNNRANHAGMGDSDTRDDISTESYPGYVSELHPDFDSINGNGIYYGVEVMYPGTLPMKSDQYSTTVRLAAMIVDTYGWTALSVFAHREHSERKWDPGQHNLAAFRRAVRDLLALVNKPKPVPTPIPGGTEMSWMAQKGASVGIVFQGDRALSIPITEAQKIADQTKAQGAPIPLVTGLLPDTIKIFQDNLVSEGQTDAETP